MVLQTPQFVAILYFYSYYRLIPTDGRKHEEDPDPSFFGDEVGHWDGDAFVIDSVGFKDTQVWADENGSPHSDALHVIERWTRPDAKHIHVDTTIEDPKFYTKTFTYSRTWEAGRSRPAPGGIFVRRKQRGPRALGIRPRADSSRWDARVRQRRAVAAASTTAHADQEIGISARCRRTSFHRQ